MNKIVKYLIVILSFLSISLSINAFAANTDCRFGCEVLDVDTVVQTEPQKMICTTTITEHGSMVMKAFTSCRLLETNLTNFHSNIASMAMTGKIG